MSKQPPPLSWRITPEQVLEALRFYSGKELQAEQTKLSSAATQLEKLSTGTLAQFLDQEERETIQHAANLVRELNIRVEHAKEIKVREEKRLERQREAYYAAATRAVNGSFPAIPTDAVDLPERLLVIIELHLGLFEGNFLDGYYAGDLTARFGRNFDRWQNGRDSLLYLVNTSLSEIKRDLEDRLHYVRSQTPDPALALQEMLEAARTKRDRVRAKNLALFDRIEHLFAIEKADNVERLPMRKKPGGRSA